MPAGDRAHLRSAERVSGEHGCFQPERIEYGDHVVAEPIRTGLGLVKSGRAEAAPRDAVDMEAVGELRREVVKHVRRIAASREEHKRPAGAAPVEHFQP